MIATSTTRITRDEAKELARERLPEVLAEIIPGFRPDRAFRCLSPDHEDRHPSMRYLSRTNTVKCFACGWSGDVFDVVGAVYGLTGGDAFTKAYSMFGLDPKRGGYSHPVKLSKPNPKPGTWDEIVSLIYPPGWDAPEPEVKLPMPLEAIAEVETGLAGCLVRHPVAIEVCIESGLKGWHFDDSEIGEFYDHIRMGGRPEDYLDSTNWLKEQAEPEHMARRLARFVVEDGQRRKLDAAFAAAYSHFQNEESPFAVLEDILNAAELATDELYDMPDADDDGMRDRLEAMFGRWLANDDPREIVAEYRRSDSNSSVAS
jgi:hypothetical protein